MTLFVGADLGYGAGAGGKPLPFFKGFYAGGPGSVRGYRFSSLGPQDLNGLALGGNRKAAFSGEVLFPVPCAAQDKSLRLAAFVDAGQVWGKDEKMSLSDLRAAAGLALSWRSPFGPLRLSFAQPLNDKAGDHTQRFQFTFGTGF